MAQLAHLPNTITAGLVGKPTTPAAHKLAQQLLEEDRQKYHCFHNLSRFHNHLSHHILVAYDFGASARLLQTIYDEEQEALKPIDTDMFDEKGHEKVVITSNNWIEHLGKPSLYGSYLKFFTEQIASTDSVQALSRYVFSEEANTDEADVMTRFLSGVFHAIIQTGYGAEFGSDAIIAQGLAQAAVNRLVYTKAQIGASKPTTDSGTPLLEIIQNIYDSDVLKPLMPYDPDATIAKRVQQLLQGGHSQKIRDLCALWFPRGPISKAEIDKKVEELFWVTTLLYAGTSKRGYEPRIDFATMHILNTTSFVPSLLKYIPRLEDQQMLLSSLLPLFLTFVVSRGRPLIDCELLMSYPAEPKYPPATSDAPDALEPLELDPWVDIVREVVHAKDAHTVKAVRSLYIGAKMYGLTQPGHAPGAGKLKGSEVLDGTAFVRAARLTLDVMGWVTKGDREGKWDFRGLGWDDAWKDAKRTQ